MNSIKELFEEEMAIHASIEEFTKRLASINAQRNELNSALKALEAEPRDNETGIGDLPEEQNISQSHGFDLPALRKRKLDLDAKASNLAQSLNRARAPLTELNAKKVKVVLSKISQSRHQTMAELRGHLAEAAPLAAALITSDIVQSRLIGEQFDYDPKQHPEIVSGRTIVSKFLEAIPSPLRPASLYSGQIEDLALWFAECTNFLDVNFDGRTNVATPIDRQDTSGPPKAVCTEAANDSGNPVRLSGRGR
jgi:seryl-tRNA synthetase